jgi:plastocyanin
MFNSSKFFAGTLLIAFLLTSVFVVVFGDAPFAEDAKPKEEVAMVTLKQEPDGISPSSLKVKLGTTIVWVNSDPGPVTIKFLDKLGIACKVPVNFHADVWGNYETGAIPEGGTASICFIYKGTYKYEVKRLIEIDGKQNEQIQTGTINAHE